MKYTEVKACLKDTDRSTLESLLNHFDADLIYQYCYDGNGLDNMEEAYQGEYSSDEEFTKQLLEGCGDIPKLAGYIHIDWEQTASDIMMDYIDIDGHYFRNM